jgi:hypothetical protein
MEARYRTARFDTTRRLRFRAHPRRTHGRLPAAPKPGNRRFSTQLLRRYAHDDQSGTLTFFGPSPAISRRRRSATYPLYQLVLEAIGYFIMHRTPLRLCNGIAASIVPVAGVFASEPRSPTSDRPPSRGTGDRRPDAATRASLTPHGGHPYASGMVHMLRILEPEPVDAEAVPAHDPGVPTHLVQGSAETAESSRQATICASPCIGGRG